MRGICNFMQRKTARRLTAVTRSNSCQADLVQGPHRLFDARVVERRVEPAEPVDSGLERRGHVGLGRHVAGDGQHLAACLLDERRGLLVAVLGPSATTTAAPSLENASAVSRPIPLPAPVTNATLPSNLRTCAVMPASWGPTSWKYVRRIADRIESVRQWSEPRRCRPRDGCATTPAAPGYEVAHDRLPRRQQALRRPGRRHDVRGAGPGRRRGREEERSRHGGRGLGGERDGARLPCGARRHRGGGWPCGGHRARV